jgi:hypothetical protein
LRLQFSLNCSSRRLVSRRMLGLSKSH